MTTATPVAKLTTPGEIVATVPMLCGFTPQDSVVLISLRGERKRIGVTMRLDLPTPGQHDGLGQLADLLVGDGASSVVIVVFSDTQPSQVDLVRELTDALNVRGVSIVEALHSDGTRWRSFTCQSSCCPVDGTPIPGTETGKLALIAAEQVGAGRQQLRSREELVASIAGTRAPDAGTFNGGSLSVPAAIALWEATLTRWPDSFTLHEQLVANLVLSLGNTRVRDEVMTFSLADDDVAEALLSLSVALAQRTPDVFSAPITTVVAMTAWLLGSGGLVNVALDRALAATPDYSMALLLRHALDATCPPSMARTLLTQTRAELDDRR